MVSPVLTRAGAADLIAKGFPERPGHANASKDGGQDVTLPKLIETFPETYASHEQVKSWFGTVLERRGLRQGDKERGEAAAIIKEMTWTGDDLIRLSEMDIESHLRSWGCNGATAELLASDIAYCSKVCHQCPHSRVRSAQRSLTIRVRSSDLNRGGGISGRR